MIIHPFRWDVSKRSQLGTLVGTPEGDKETWLRGEVQTGGSYWNPYFTYEWFVTELRRCSARIIAFCDNSDLFFVGRSPDSIFDYLSGLLFDTNWANRLNLLHFSTGWLDWQEAFEYNPSAITDMRQYL